MSTTLLHDSHIKSSCHREKGECFAPPLAESPGQHWPWVLQVLLMQAPFGLPLVVFLHWIVLKSIIIDYVYSILFEHDLFPDHC